MPCNIHAICFGMNHTAPRPGYWRQNATQEVYYECPKAESCLGGNITNPFGDCAEGYRGILCTDCQDGFTRKGAYSCDRCPRFLWNLILFLILMVVMVIVIIFLVRS